MPLTDVAIRRAKPADKPQKLSDAGGLYLYITVAGAKSWRWKYRFAGKEKVLALGLYPDVSLANAREARDDAQRLLAGGIHPSAQKKVPSSPTPPSVQTRKPMDAHGVPSQLCLQVTFAFWVADYPSPSTH